MKSVTFAILALISAQSSWAASSCQERVRMLTDAGVPADLLNELGTKAHLGTRPAGSLMGDQNIAMIADYSQPSTSKRLYVIDLSTGHVSRQLISHGKGSGDNLMAKKFSDDLSSNATALGLYRIAPPRNRATMDPVISDVAGLEATNKNAKRRHLIFHGCKFVSEKSHRAGRSFGDFCVDPMVAKAYEKKVRQRETLLLAGKSTGKAMPDLAKNEGLCKFIQNLGLVPANAASEVPSEEEIDRSNSAE